MQERPPEQASVPTANDRLKARWKVYVVWSTFAAVATHAAILGLTPAWELSYSPFDPPVEMIGLGWDTPEGTGGSIGEAELAALPLEDEEPSPSEEEADLGDGAGGEEVALATRSELMREVLRRMGDPAPMISEPEPEPQLDDLDGELVVMEEAPDSSIGGDPSAAEYAALLESSGLDLGRLSAVHPELALAPPSLWVLIRNSPEVRSYMRRVYERGLDPRASGTVGVTLWIDESGSVEWAEISRSSGRSDLDEVALALLQEVADFMPARDRGIPVPTSAMFELSFPWF
jgi:TonB family protein